MIVQLFICSTDDILETFLSEYRQKKRPHSRTTPSQLDHTPTPGPTNQSTASESQHGKSSTSHLDRRPERVEGEREGGVCFSIPELPIGRELVLNILTTWGDRFYVGLTGIEIYTASGEPAKIAQVSLPFQVQSNLHYETLIIRISEQHVLKFRLAVAVFCCFLSCYLVLWLLSSIRE